MTARTVLQQKVLARRGVFASTSRVPAVCLLVPSLILFLEFWTNVESSVSTPRTENNFYSTPLQHDISPPTSKENKTRRENAHRITRKNVPFASYTLISSRHS